MIVVISDLHLQHTSHDVLRWREGDRVFECGVRRNVSAAALELLFTETCANVRRCQAPEVHLVLAGDIFEIHRSPQWFFGGSSLRPTLAPAATSAELLARTELILDAIVRDNQDFFDTLRQFASAGTFAFRGQQQQRLEVPLTVHFIPGNHDRLLGVFPSVRRKVRELLCMPPEAGTAPFPHELEWSDESGGGVRVRHGHEYDATNFGAEFDAAATPRSAYELPSLGDYVTVDIVTRIAVAFRVYYAVPLRQAGPNGDFFRKLYLALTEFDDVRPPAALAKYLADAGRAGGQRVFALLRPVLLDLVETARGDSFLAAESDRLGFFPVKELLLAALDQLLSYLGNEHVERVVALLAEVSGKTSRLPESVALEPGVAQGDIAVLVAGHTHQPGQLALPAPPGRAATFVDSGTWRTQIDAGIGGTFGRLRSCTMVFCYVQSERTTARRTFETWTGHMAADDYGTYLAREVEATTAGAAIVEFTQLSIVHIDEGETEDGAELELHLGVDDQEIVLRRHGVHDGEEIPLEPGAHQIRLDGALDGELWCWGLERDLGASLLDRDDALPWATDFLPRGATAAQSGSSGSLQLANNRGSRLVLSYRFSRAMG